jgi:hypothetical protein
MANENRTILSGSMQSKKKTAAESDTTLDYFTQKISFIYKPPRLFVGPFENPTRNRMVKAVQKPELKKADIPMVPAFPYPVSKWSLYIFKKQLL